MAGIDKTYTKLYSEYKTYKKWAEDDQKFFNLYKYKNNFLDNMILR